MLHEIIHLKDMYNLKNDPILEVMIPCNKDEDSYILFSDEEIENLSDEVTQPDMSNDIQEDLNFSG